MDVAELVRTVVREVLERTRAQDARPCVRILGPREERLADALRGQLEVETELRFCGEDLQGRVPGRHVLPFLPCCHMADLAVGRASDPQSAEVLRLLLGGTEVEVLEFEYKTYRETAPGPLFRLYEGYEKTLAGYGLVAFRARRPDTLRSWEALVTEKIVGQALEKGASRLLVPLTAKVTPLAADAAARERISILKQL